MDPLTWLLVNLFSLLATALQLFVPIFLGSVILTFFFNYVQKKTRWKWIGAAALTLFLAFALVLFFIHAWNIWNGVTSFDPTQVPPPIQENPEYIQTQPTVFSLMGKAILSSLFSAALFALILLPFAFLGVTFFDVLKKRVPGFWSRMIILSYAGSVFFLLLLVIFPWIPVSLLYLAFFGL